MEFYYIPAPIPLECSHSSFGREPLALDAEPLALGADPRFDLLDAEPLALARTCAAALRLIANKKKAVYRKSFSFDFCTASIELHF